jgi:hypothetical protein
MAIAHSLIRSVMNSSNTLTIGAAQMIIDLYRRMSNYCSRQGEAPPDAMSVDLRI